MKYFFLDIDGTLYSPKINGVPKSAQEAINDARKAGNKIFLCTGRLLGECEKYLSYPTDGYVFGAGAFIYAGGKRIYDHPIPTSDVEMLKQILEKHGLGYTSEGSAGAYSNPSGYESALKYFGAGETDPDQLTRRARDNGFYTEVDQHELDPIYKICFYTSDYHQFAEIQKELPKPYHLTVSMRDPDNLNHIAEITDGNITKATGIQHVLEYEHADVKDAVAIGDSENDIPMIKYCGMGIAMGNAVPQVKEAADWTTTDILEDGIRNAFEKVLKED